MSVNNSRTSKATRFDDGSFERGKRELSDVLNSFAVRRLHDKCDTLKDGYVLTQKII